MPASIRLGTRGSKLALTQSESIANELRDLGHEVELIVLKTTGDVTAGSLSNFGGEGVFTKRLQQALLEHEIDLAVHSLKDLPTEPTDGLIVASVPVREDVRDALLVPEQQIMAFQSLADLPTKARIGTGSVRRQAQLQHLRPDLVIEDIRGNVDTRIAKLDDGDFDALVLACAGLNRLGLSSRIAMAFATSQLAPAVGQGALGLETRQGDANTQDAVLAVNDPATHAAVVAERAMLNALRAGCMAPVGTVSNIQQQQLALTGVVFSSDGSEKIEASEVGSFEQSLDVGKKVAEKLLENGASRLILGAKNRPDSIGF